MKKLLIVFILLSFGLISFAQQDAMFTHNMFNTVVLNPAYAGSREALSVTGLHRQQWVGFDGAPITQSLSLHTPFVSQNVGLGVSFINDKIGAINTTSFFADFSYTIKVSKSSKLAFGLKGGANLIQKDLSNIDLKRTEDPAFGQNVQNQILPNFGFGLYYYTPKWYLGISVPKLLENNFKGLLRNRQAKEARHYFVIAGTIFNLNEQFKLKPSTFIKSTKGAPIQAELSTQLIYNDIVWLGLMYRTGDAIGTLVGVNITPQLAIGYSFDWSIPNKTLVYNGGSHEIMLRYDFVFDGQKKIRSPRYL